MLHWLQRLKRLDSLCRLGSRLSSRLGGGLSGLAESTVETKCQVRRQLARNRCVSGGALCLWLSGGLQLRQNAVSRSRRLLLLCRLRGLYRLHRLCWLCGLDWLRVGIGLEDHASGRGGCLLGRSGSEVHRQNVV